MDLKTKNLVETLIQWFIFTVAIAITPFLLQMIGVAISKSTPKWVEVVRHGGLLLVAVGIASDGLGRLLGIDEKGDNRILILLVGGLVTLMLVLCVWSFAEVSNRILSRWIGRDN